MTPIVQQPVFSPQLTTPMGQLQMTPNMYAFGMPQANQIGSGMMGGQMMMNPQMMNQQMATPQMLNQQMATPQMMNSQAMNPQLMNQHQMMMMNPMMMGMANQGYFGMPQMGQSPQAYNPLAAMSQMNPQMLAMMQMMQAGYGQPAFGQSPGDEQSDFMSMLEMFAGGMGGEQQEDDLEKLLQDVEFERRLEEASRFEEDTKNFSLKRKKEVENSNFRQTFVEKRKNCSCCKGYIYNCKGAACMSTGQCNCMVS
jgi:hypothetical protein